MILSKLTVRWLEWIIEIGIWLSLIGAFIGGWSMGNGFFGGIFSAVISTLFAGVFCALVFGGFIVIMEIRKSVRAIEQRGSQS